MALEDIIRDQQNLGIGASWAQGAKEGADLRSVTANTAQTQAQTQRYTGETPSYLRGQEALARQKELANLQPEAEATLGLPMDRASLAKKETAISAEKADEIRRQLGPAKTLQILNETEKENAAVLDVADRFLQMYPTADQAIAAFKQKFPQYTQDPQFDAMAARWKGKSSAQASSELTMWRNKIASGIATAKAEQQAELQKIDLQGQNQRDLANIQGQYSLQGAQARAAAGEGKPTMATVYTKYLDQFTRSPEGSPEKEEARVILNMLKGGGTTTEESGIPGLAPIVKSKEALPGKGGNTDIASSAKQAFGAYEPSKYDYRINPSTGKVQRKPK